MNQRKNAIFSSTLLVGCLLLISTGCSSTFKTRNVEPTGFLGDYSQLKEGSDKEAQLIYINPDADFSQYTKIVMDPVRIYANKNGDLEKISEEDRQRVVNYLHAKIVEQLQPDYTFVEEPGDGVMRLRVAITEAKASNVLLDTSSSIIPIGMAVGLIKDIATGTNLAVGKAGIEMELLDSQTGERLAAVVDERAGRKYTGKFDKFNKYHAVEDAFDHWAERMKKRLAELRQK